MAKKSKGNRSLIFVVCLLCAFALTYDLENDKRQQTNDTVAVDGNFFGDSDEKVDGSFYTLYDSASKEPIEYMARHVYEGDELITSDNKHYRVIKLEGDQAYCDLIGERKLNFTFPTLSEDDSNAVAVAKQNQYQSVAIYTTHTDESYVPTSGTESKKGEGDILKVAGVIAEELEKQGVEVLHSDNIHDPHDVNAYQRSRKTAAELLRNGPAAIIDVHRDGIPDPGYYATNLNGKDATQIRLVVGKQNQNSEANIAFAEKMKAYYDETKPGLIKSIYMAKGNYNQDMAPNSILLEIGTHTNTLDAAENGAQEFAQGLPQFLGISTNQQPNNTATPQANTAANNDKNSNSGMSTSIIILVVIAVIGGLAFMFLSKGSLMGKK